MSRVKMPHNNRLSSSVALRTNDIWSKTIGFDPYASGQEAKPDDDLAQQHAAGLMLLMKMTNASGSDTRGSCKKCGQLGHLTFQCRNTVRETKREAANEDSSDSGSSSNSDDDGDKAEDVGIDKRTIHSRSERSRSRDRDRDRSRSRDRMSNHRSSHGVSRTNTQLVDRRSSGNSDYEIIHSSLSAVMGANQSTEEKRKSKKSSKSSKNKSSKKHSKDKKGKKDKKDKKEKIK